MTLRSHAETELDLIGMGPDAVGLKKKITFPYTPTREYLPTNAREQYSQEFSSK